MIESLNSGVRFLLEIAGLVSIGYWGFQLTDGILRWLIMLIPPLIVATVWAVFRVPGDGGDPVIVVSGLSRLLIEAAVFTLAVLALAASGQGTYAIVLAVIVLGHYAVGWERIRWLLRQ
jgi:hypothetical protein